MNDVLKKRISNIPYRVTRMGNGANDAYNEGVKYGAEWMLNNQWISVGEALPVSDDEVLAMFPDGSCTIVRRVEKLYVGGLKKEWRNGDYVYDDAWIRYWMPIPKLDVK